MCEHSGAQLVARIAILLVLFQMFSTVSFAALVNNRCSFEDLVGKSDMILIGAVSENTSVAQQETKKIDILDANNEVLSRAKIIPLQVFKGGKGVRVLTANRARGTPTSISILYPSQIKFAIVPHKIYLFFLSKNEDKAYRLTEPRVGSLPLHIAAKDYIAGASPDTDKKREKELVAFWENRKVYHKKIETLKKEDPLREKKWPYFSPLPPVAERAIIETVANTEMGHREHLTFVNLLIENSDIGKSAYNLIITSDQQYWTAIKKLADKQLLSIKKLAPLIGLTQVPNEVESGDE